MTTSTRGVLTISLTGISRSHEFKQAIRAGLGGILAMISRQHKAPVRKTPNFGKSQRSLKDLHTCGLGVLDQQSQNSWGVFGQQFLRPYRKFFLLNHDISMSLSPRISDEAAVTYCQSNFPSLCNLFWQDSQKLQQAHATLHIVPQSAHNKIYHILPFQHLQC